ncbi:Proton-dependent oligopeptide transporter family [Trinorchestia longiramus]|nr:Proton-dependent oligopeptide transporter family [Trinorchestia longiramus]
MPVARNDCCDYCDCCLIAAVLTIYLHSRLQYSEDNSTVIYHAWSMLCYLTPILGSLVADLALGRYRTILYLSAVYLVGNLTLSLSAVPPVAPTLPQQIGTAIFGLVLIAIGTGGIKPCVSAFGGDQFILPQQAKQLGTFFSIFYFSINLGSLLSTVISPLLREHTTCFNDSCYFAAFGFPAMLMAVALCESSGVVGLVSAGVVGLVSAGVVSAGVVGLVSAGVVGLVSAGVVGLVSASVVGLVSDSVPRCQTPSSGVRLRPQVSDSVLRCQTPSSGVRLRPQVSDSVLRCQTPSSGVRLCPQITVFSFI